MPAPNILAATRINADRAGFTTEAQFNPTAEPTSPSEFISNTFHDSMGGLSEMLAGGIHPESPLVVPVPTSVTKASDSIIGRLGGLVPKNTGTLAPGPAGLINSAGAKARDALKRLGF